MKTKLASLIILIFATSAHATDYVIPDQKIVGAEQPVPLGELVDLGVTPVTTKPLYWVSASYSWKVVDLSTGEEKRFRPVGDDIIFGTGLSPKKLKVFVAVSHLYVVPNGESATRVVFLSADLVLGTGTPTPAPTPPDQPPVLPTGKFGLAAYAYQTASQIPGDHAFAKTLATNFKAVSDDIKAGKFQTAQQVLAAVKALNDKTPDQQTDAWKTWLVALGDKLFDLVKAGSLTSLDDYYQVFSELIAGLSAIK
jgi:hypothetical protein